MSYNTVLSSCRNSSLTGGNLWWRALKDIRLSDIKHNTVCEWKLECVCVCVQECGMTMNTL